MKLIQETDIFSYINGGKEAILNKQIAALISTGSKIVTKELDYDLRTIEKSFKDPLTTATMKAIAESKIIPIIANESQNAMPTYMPFVKYKGSNGMKIAVDITQFAHIKNDVVNEEISISIDRRKLYVLLVSAYLYYYHGDKTSVLTPRLMQITAIDWAKIFTKIFDIKLGLSTNKERKDTFMYLAAKYYLINILEAPEGVIDGIALQVFKDKLKNSLCKQIEITINERGIDLYKDLTTFTTTLLNADITGLKNSRAKITQDVGFQFYMKEFITMFGLPAGFSLAAFPYFIWMLISANNGAWIFTGERTVETLTKDDFPTLMSEIYRLIRVE